MKIVRSLLVAAAFGQLLGATPSWAQSFTFIGDAPFVAITNNDPANASGAQSQLNLGIAIVDADPTQVLLTISNTPSSVEGVVVNVYVDDAAGILDSFSSVRPITDIAFEEGGDPATLPGGDAVGFTESFAFAASDPPQSGIGRPETAGFIFNLEPGKTANDVAAAFEAGTVRVGLNVVAFGNGGSESLATVPEAGSVALAAAALGGLAAIGRFRRRR